MVASNELLYRLKALFQFKQRDKGIVFDNEEYVFSLIKDTIYTDEIGAIVKVDLDVLMLNIARAIKGVEVSKDVYNFVKVLLACYAELTDYEQSKGKRENEVILLLYLAKYASIGAVPYDTLFANLIKPGTLSLQDGESLVLDSEGANQARIDLRNKRIVCYNMLNTTITTHKGVYWFENCVNF